MWSWVKKLALAGLKKLGIYTAEQAAKAVVKKFEKK
jgi:hypothetical protein